MRAKKFTYAFEFDVSCGPADVLDVLHASVDKLVVFRAQIGRGYGAFVQGLRVTLYDPVEVVGLHLELVRSADYEANVTSAFRARRGGGVDLCQRLYDLVRSKVNLVRGPGGRPQGGGGVVGPSDDAFFDRDFVSLKDVVEDA